MEVYTSEVAPIPETRDDRRAAIDQACRENCDQLYGSRVTRLSAHDWYAFGAIAFVAIFTIYLAYLV
jgi:hypothetical protein